MSARTGRTAPDAFLRLPPGYALDLVTDADVVGLVAPNGKTVARFTLALDPDELERAAREHAERIDAAIGSLEALLEERRSR